MSIFNKLKNIFTEPDEDEEEEVEETETPIKKEVFQVEIPAPKIEEKKEEVVEEKKEEKFVFPVFDDDDFKEEPRHVETSKKPLIEVRRPNIPAKKPEPRKTFKPSPVISPVYGILDKNYKKEDIVQKKPISTEKYFNFSEDAASVDAVRKKAFGTLEDELENNLETEEQISYTEVKQVVTPEVKEQLEKEANEDQDTNTDSLEEMFFNKDMTLEEAINQYETKERKNEKEEKDDLIESDLFNLIDSMYDKEEEDE